MFVFREHGGWNWHTMVSRCGSWIWVLRVYRSISCYGAQSGSSGKEDPWYSTIPTVVLNPETLLPMCQGHLRFVFL